MSKCQFCGNDMVWVGDMLTGGLECTTNHYATVECDFDEEGSTEEEKQRIRKAFEQAFQNPDLRKKMADNAKRNNALLEKLKPDLIDPDGMICTDYFNDRLNLFILDRYGNVLAGRKVQAYRVRDGGIFIHARLTAEHSSIASTFAIRDDYGSTVLSGSITPPLGGGDMIMHNLHLTAGQVVTVEFNIKEA